MDGECVRVCVKTERWTLRRGGGGPSALGLQGVVLDITGETGRSKQIVWSKSGPVLPLIWKSIRSTHGTFASFTGNLDCIKTSCWNFAISLKETWKSTAQKWFLSDWNVNLRWGKGCYLLHQDGINCRDWFRVKPHTAWVLYYTVTLWSLHTFPPNTPTTSKTPVWKCLHLKEITADFTKQIERMNYHVL